MDPNVADHDIAAMRRLLQLLMTADENSARLDDHPMPVGLVRHNRLAPLCFHRGHEAFRNDFIASAAQALERERQLREALDALGNASVKVALIKGASYVRTIYADAALRPMDDLDLLVPQAQFQRATDTLKELGYTIDGKFHGLSRAHHALTLGQPAPWTGCIDLHRSITQPYRSRIDLNDVWQRALPLPDAPTTFLLDPLDETLFHLVHASRHQFWVPCIAYVDASRLLYRLGDGGRERLLDRAHRFRLGKAIRASLAVVDMLRRHEARVQDVSPRCAPGADELVQFREPGRLRQLMRKISLLEGPGEAIGLARAYVEAKWWFRSKP